MFVDASAMVAILTGEDGAERLASRLESAPARLTSAVAIYETTTALVRLKSYTVPQAQNRVRRFLDETRIELSAIGEEEASGALAAFDRYGKGRHPAALNMGDCFAYACAKTLNTPLLYKGEDFSKTDLA